MEMSTSVERYFESGCGRCELGGTPECKVHLWTDELQYLRNIILGCGLAEESKWGVPVYVHQGQNVLALSALKGCAVIGFFKGVLLKDTEALLQAPGPNSQAIRQFQFTSLAEIQAHSAAIEAYIYEAMELQNIGAKVDFKAKADMAYPDELRTKMAEDPALEQAFEALTPGRRRGYVLHFSGAKQSQTRLSRIEKCIPKIMAGKGFHDRD